MILNGDSVKYVIEKQTTAQYAWPFLNSKFWTDLLCKYILFVLGTGLWSGEVPICVDSK
jgi:hypothetical protein